MSGKNINFDDKKIKKSGFYKNKNVFQIDYTDVNKILVYKKAPYGTRNSFKYFIGYKDNDIIRPLCVRHLQMNGNGRKFDGNATLSFRANNKQLLKTYNKLWEKVEKLLKIDFESKPGYSDNEEYIKTERKIYAGSMVTNFHNKKMPKEKVPCKCLSIIMLDSIIKSNKKYYPQTLLEECKYVQEKINIENLLDDD